ncbi:MAG: T9SS type A sorting domain-containing protein [Ignavibacteriaceae bacterium]|nr:T9SS type A sorting domain-containing protein [Ignavibacteriaceae bacterium]
MDNRTGVYQIWTVPIDISLVNVEPSSEAISEFQLEQNYPNPFNPNTKIRFRISDFGFVSLKIFDVLGNEIATLINEEKPMGNYEVEFITNDKSSGIYFYQLTAGSFTDTKKMILLR